MKDMYDVIRKEVARYLGPKGLMPSPKKGVPSPNSQTTTRHASDANWMIGTVGENLDAMFKALSLVTKYEADEDNLVSVGRCCSGCLDVNLDVV